MCNKLAQAKLMYPSLSQLTLGLSDGSPLVGSLEMDGAPLLVGTLEGRPEILGEAEGMYLEGSELTLGLRLGCVEELGLKLGRGETVGGDVTGFVGADKLMN